tara:strand:- start:1752 stop:1913 length:162 start_codon:yes stop_codon:yes gene_type:complete
LFYKILTQLLLSDVLYLSRLKEICNGDKDFEREMVVSFAVDAPICLSKLKKET